MSKNTGDMEAAVNFRWDDQNQSSQDAEMCKMVFCIARIDNHHALAREFSLDPEISISQLILHLYRNCGTDCAKQLLGDFVFAIWDPEKRYIYAARDFMGCQPVYYRRDGQSLIIADDIEKLIALSTAYPAPDEAYIAASLTSAFAHHERTHFANIRKIAPAHYLIASKGSCETYRYWRAEDIAERRWSDHDDCLEEFRTLLKQAIRDRLPRNGRTGVHVSGGLDCSSLAILAAEELRSENRKPPVALSWYPPPHSDHTDYEKSEYDRIFSVCEKANIEPVFTTQTAQNIRDVLRRDNRVRPLCNASYNERLVQKEAREMGVSVILSGFGGDEAASFDGRGHFQQLALTGRWLKLAKFAKASGANPLRFCVRHLISGLSDLFLSDADLKKMTDDIAWRDVPYWKALLNILNPFSRHRNLTPSKEQQKLLDEGVPYINKTFEGRVEPLPAFPPIRRTNSKSVRCQLLQWSINTARIESWAADGARFGIRYTYPLLDRRVVEFALSLPGHMFIDDNHKRIFFRKAMAPVLPHNACWEETKADPARIDPLIKSMMEAYVSIGEQLKRQGTKSPKAAYIDMPRFIHDLEAEKINNRTRKGKIILAMEFLGIEDIEDIEDIEEQ
ncbi:asparagine synthase-related protein [Parasphingorhabdus sp.]|uniref:asparagine synthase-related protein n=1 Tax=Parasphingorhabdus sp. TaxID=2709688 RepID=UPI0039E21623